MTDSQSDPRSRAPAARAGPAAPSASAASGRVRRRGGRDRRRDLLAAARRLFLAEGYEGTSVAAIVRAADVAQGTFYLYFKSKEQVLLRLRGEVLGEYLAAFRAGSAGPGNAGPGSAATGRGPARADERLVRGLARIDRAVRRNRPLLGVFRRAASGEETERVWLEGRAALAEPLAALLAEGRADGSLRMDDPRMAAHLVLALFDNLLYEALEYRRPASGRETLVHGSRFMLRALGAEEARVEALVPLVGDAPRARRRPKRRKGSR